MSEFMQGQKYEVYGQPGTDKAVVKARRRLRLARAALLPGDLETANG